MNFKTVTIGIVWSIIGFNIGFNVWNLVFKNSFDIKLDNEKEFANGYKERLIEVNKEIEKLTEEKEKAIEISNSLKNVNTKLVDRNVELKKEIENLRGRLKIEEKILRDRGIFRDE